MIKIQFYYFSSNKIEFFKLLLSLYENKIIENLKCENGFITNFNI